MVEGGLRMKKVIVLLLTGSLATLLHATTPQPAPAPAIVYVNGVGNTFDKAVASLQVLKNKLNSRDTDKAYMYGNAYNATEGAFLDVRQVFGTKAIEGSTPADFWRAIDGDTLPAGGMDAALQRKYIDILAANHIPELPGHLGKYRAFLKQKRQIVLVAHSQGSLYANFAINLLVTGPDQAQGKISTVNVGNAARYQLPGSSYVTSDSDTVINLLRAVTEVLPANYSVRNRPSADSLGHSFVKTYLNAKLPLAEEILKQVSLQAE
jgi:hypothetical protein